MTSLEWRRYTRYALRTLYELVDDGVLGIVSSRDTVRQAVGRFLARPMDRLPKGDPLLQAHHERAVICWLWVKNETCILGLTLRQAFGRA